MEQMLARTQAINWQKNELHICSTDEKRWNLLFQSSEHDCVHSRSCFLGVSKGIVLNFLSSDAQWEDLSNGVSIVVILLVDRQDNTYEFTWLDEKLPWVFGRSSLLKTISLARKERNRMRTSLLPCDDSGSFLLDRQRYGEDRVGSWWSLVHRCLCNAAVCLSLKDEVLGYLLVRRQVGGQVSDDDLLATKRYRHLWYQSLMKKKRNNSISDKRITQGETKKMIHICNCLSLAWHDQAAMPQFYWSLTLQPLHYARTLLFLIRDWEREKDKEENIKRNSERESDCKTPPPPPPQEKNLINSQMRVNIAFAKPMTSLGQVMLVILVLRIQVMVNRFWLHNAYQPSQSIHLNNCRGVGRVSGATNWPHYPKSEPSLHFHNAIVNPFCACVRVMIATACWMLAVCIIKIIYCKVTNFRTVLNFVLWKKCEI